MSWILKFFGISSGTLYALVGVLVVVSGLSAAVYVESLRLDAATSRVKSLEKDNAEYAEAIKQSEEDKARLLERQHLLDAALADASKRLNALLVKEGNLRDQYNQLKAKLEKADQDCLDRRLPDSIAERLRDSDAGHKDGDGKSPAVDDAPRSEVEAP